MWHEARKQERRIRGLIVDYRRRAERRQDFYEKIQADPTQFIQIHGRRCKIHLDPAVFAAGDGAAIIVPWQGQHDNLIDRFDVRAHLDYIPVVPKSADSLIDISQEERQCNYERYRILAQNDFLNVTEEKFLHQLYLEEQFGANAPLEGQSNQSKKKAQKSGAAIGYSYDDSTENTQDAQPFSHLKHSTPGGILGGPLSGQTAIATKPDNESESDSDSDMDVDVSIEVTKLDTNQAHELNACGRNYGMLSNDFYSYLTKDADEADALRLAREEEREKILLGGRKSRRERRAQKERRIARRPFSPPSYAAKEVNIGKDEESDSRSPSPSDTTEKITYITSFGGEDELQPHSKISITLGKGSSTLGAACVGATTSAASGQTTYAQKVKENLEKLNQLNATSKWRDSRSRSYSRSRSRSRTLRRSRRSDRKSRSRSSSYKRHRKTDKKRSISRSRSRSRSRSLNKLRSSYSRRYREGYNRSITRSHSRSHSKSRRRRYPSLSTDRSSVSPSRTNYKAKRMSKRSPKNTLYSSRKSRSASHSNTRQSKTSKVKEESKSPHKSIEAAFTKQSEIVMTSITSTIPLKPALTNPSQPVPAPTELVANKQSVPIENVIEPPPPPLKRYYGRKKDEYSSESNSESDNDVEDNASQVLKAKEATDTQDAMEVDTTSEKSNPLPSTLILSYKERSHSQQTGKYGSNTSNSNAPEIKASSGSGIGGSGSSSGRLNLRERLKRKMQNLLNKQYKADKKAEIEKTERERQLQQEREEEMRELSIKLRRRQRELRHRYGSQNSKESGSDNSDTAVATKSKRSESRSSERSSVKIARCHSREHKRQSPLTCSSSRERRRSPSRYARHPKSRSQSRSRRSNSRRRRRSGSRSTRYRESSYERSSRYNTERSRHEDRLRRSISRNERERGRDCERGRDRDRDSFRHRDRDRDNDRQRYWGSSGTSDRHRSERAGDGRERSDRDRHRDRQQPVSSSTSAGTNSRSRVVISAPPKLKKLVDY